MHSDDAEREMREHLEISLRFRRLIEQRIDQLESDAALDEAVLTRLANRDHIRRHTRLVSAEREEAGRMRRFLERSSTRVPSPTTAV